MVLQAFSIFSCKIQVLLLSGHQLFHWYTEAKKEDWRGAVAHVASHAKPDDAVVFSKSFLSYPFCYYFEELNTAGVELIPYFFEDQQVKWHGDSHCMMKKPSLTSSSNFESAYKKVWVILSHVNEEQSQTIEDFFLNNYKVSSITPFYDIKILFYIQP